MVGEAKPGAAVVLVEGLTKTFTRGRDRTTALDGIDLRVARGEILGVLGPNGAGKTTLINVLSTLVLPNTGRASIDGADVVADAARVRSAIAVTGQFAAVDGELTGAENLVFFGRLRGLERMQATRRADELLAMLDLTTAATKPVKTYSGGMRRRLDIAVSMVTEPVVLFLDEPTTGLDPRSRNELWELVEQLRDRGVTILLTTQYLEELERLADRIVVIDRGRVIAEGTAASLTARIGPPELRVGLAEPAAAVSVAATLADLSASVLEEGMLSVPMIRGAHTVAEVMARLGASDTEPTDLWVHRPTLDDVFLALTGHRTDPANDDDPLASPR